MDGFLELITSRAQPDLDWNYALVTLVFRFFAVFVVLWLIQFAMWASGRVIRWLEEDESQSASSPNPGPAAAAASGSSSASDGGGIDAATIAVIGAALEIEAQPEAARVPEQRQPSAWAVAGRAKQHRSR
ncbi:MAG: OadG family transporter subunit [Myxococcales bacterium]|nr:OadG family transporter subunit [Myxococcales bacterium]